MGDQFAKSACYEVEKVLAPRMYTLEEFEALDEDEQLNVFKPSG